MRYLTAICLSAAVSFGAVSTAKAQGESDPGLSQLGAMRSGAATIVTEDEYESNKVQFSVSNTFARGEKDVKYNIPQAEIIAPIASDATMGYFHIRIPFVSASGELGNKWGLGDLGVSYTHFLMADPENWTIQATAGLQFGMTTANLSDTRSRPLPMSYQSSMGSTEALAGVNFSWKEYLRIAAGYQQAIIRYKQNDYTGLSYFNDPIYSSSDYTVGRKLYRYGDAMMRVEGHLTGNRAGFTAGALGFYHVHDDLYMDPFYGWQYIKDSHGFSMNLTGNAFIRFGRYGSCKLDVSGAIPLITRAVRPDGTQRQWVIMPRFTYYFGQHTLLF